jgi:hypothetical protein
MVSGEFGKCASKNKCKFHLFLLAHLQESNGNPVTLAGVGV